MPNKNTQPINITEPIPSQYQKIILKNIKHDLINPINAMIGYSELTLDELNDTSEDQFISDDIKNIYQLSKDIFKRLQDLFSENLITRDNKYIFLPLF